MSTTEPQWYCLKAQTKREHIAADHVRQVEGVEVFLPRIRFQRKTARGLAWFTEALFPGYLFARFNFQLLFRQIQHANGVRGIVHFGERWPVVPPESIAELQASLGSNEVHVVDAPLVEGEEVEIAEGAFRGLKAVVARVLPAKTRVRILLEFLGRQSSVEIAASGLIREGDQRRAAFR